MKRRLFWRASAGKIVLGQKALSVSLMILLLAMGILYLSMVNVGVTKGFEIKDLEKKIAELEKNQKLLKTQSTELQSIQNIEKQLNLGEYVPVTVVNYLKATNFAQK